MSESRPFVHDMKNYLGIILGYTTLLMDSLPANDLRRGDVEEIRLAGESALSLLEQWKAAEPEDGAR